MADVTFVHQDHLISLRTYFGEFRIASATCAEVNQPIPFPTCGEQAVVDVLPRLLAWDDFDELLKTLCVWHLGHVFCELLRVCGKIEQVSAGDGNWLKDSIRALPDWALARVLAAPETSRRIAKIQYGTSRHVEFFRSAISVEEILQGRNSPRPCWSGLGDFYFAGSTICDPRYEDWNPEQSLVAPRLGSLIPVDFLSPHAREINSLPNCPFVPYTPQEAAAIWKNLDTALSHIASIDRNACSLIRRFVSVVVPRTNPSRPHSSGASSTPSHIGRLLIRNCHLMSVGGLIDSLVHEAIHALLFVIEICEPFITDMSANQIFVRSPWSNNLLPVQTYLHACFVWYGLANFWAHAEVSGLLRPDSATNYRTIAMSGYQSVNPVDALLPHRHLVRSTILDVVGSLQNALRNGHEGQPEFSAC